MKRTCVIHLLPPYIAIPPNYYGGTERVAYVLFKKLHEIRDHITSIEFLPILIGKISDNIDRNLRKYAINVNALIPNTNNLNIHMYMFNLNRVVNIIEKEFGCDHVLLHNHIIQRNSWIHLIRVRYRSLTTLHYDPPLLTHLGLHIVLPKKMLFVAISLNQYLRLKPVLGSSLITYVHNGLELQECPFSKSKGDYFIFVAALTPSKGAHIAAQLANKLKFRLVIVGPLRDKQYFEKFIKPQLGRYVEYLGEVEETKKRELLTRARALLFPVLREEFFGLNVIEALACGTPVIAFSRGAMQELILHGKVGFLAHSFQEFAKFIKDVDKLDPRECREYALRRFSAESMAFRYVKLYELISKTL